MISCVASQGDEMHIYIFINQVAAAAAAATPKTQRRRNVLSIAIGNCAKSITMIAQDNDQDDNGRRKKKRESLQRCKCHNGYAPEE